MTLTKDVSYGSKHLSDAQKGGQVTDRVLFDMLSSLQSAPG